MGESFAGITVPDGEPEGLRTAASSFDGLSGQLSTAGHQLAGLPGSMAGWSGPASVAYASSCSGLADDPRCRRGRRNGRTRGAPLRRRAVGRPARRAARDRGRPRRPATHRRRAGGRQPGADRCLGGRDARIPGGRHGGGHQRGGRPLRARPRRPARRPRTGADAGARETSGRNDLARARGDLEDAQRRGRHAEERARDAAATRRPASTPPATGPGWARPRPAPRAPGARAATPGGTTCSCGRGTSPPAPMAGTAASTSVPPRSSAVPTGTRSTRG